MEAGNDRRATMSGITSNFTYDAWGRLATRSALIGRQTYTATYTYWFGDKLKRVDSDFPGETALVQYNYDGLGKRRLKVVGNDTTYWRWDTGYSTVAQYQDQTPDWDITGFDRFFVPFGHTALAEATLDGSGNPANAIYTYLAHDHLGSSRYGFNHAKSEQFTYEHLPFGQRYTTTGTAPYHEFTGKPWDPDIQMFYFPFRYYSPNMARWTMADPGGMVDGPNFYGYVLSNPVSNLDPLGLTALPSEFPFPWLVAQQIGNALRTALTQNNCDIWISADPIGTTVLGRLGGEILWHVLGHYGGHWEISIGRDGCARRYLPVRRSHAAGRSMRVRRGRGENARFTTVYCCHATCADIINCLESTNSRYLDFPVQSRRPCQDDTMFQAKSCCLN